MTSLTVLIMLLVALGAFCSAVRDTITQHWHTSKLSTIFKDYPRFMKWLGPTSWQLKYVNWPKDTRRKKWRLWFISFNKPLIFTDAWHLLKSIEITAYLLAVSLAPFGMPDVLIDLILYGLIWNITFNAWYNSILPKR